MYISVYHLCSQKVELTNKEICRSCEKSKTKSNQDVEIEINKQGEIKRCKKILALCIL